MKRNKNVIYLLILVLLTILANSCSTTRRLEDDEVLYTGVKKMQIVAHDSTSLPSGVQDQIKEVLNVAPNNPLFSPYVRTPFPVGLWVYNNWNVTPESSGFKKWLYNLLVREPVLISTVRPELRMRMLKTILDNNGYFGSSATFEIIPNKKNPRKARISYFVKASKPYCLSDIEYIAGDDALTLTIDSLAKRSSYLRSGSIFNVDSLNILRTDIANYLRNRGYYYFQPDNIEYFADSTISQGKIALKLDYAKNISPEAKRKYRTRSITTTIHRNEGGGVPDTMYTKRGTVIQMTPSKLRKSLIPSCLTFRKGKIVSVRDMNRTQSYLSRLGIFKSINIAITPIDSLKPGQDSLDIFVDCVFDSPLEASLELNASYKSNSFIGPGIRAGIAHNNLFGGGERLSFDLTGSYEWQIGKAGGSGDNNYYEIGLSTTLAFPRLLAPKFIARSRRELNWTEISLSANLYNNPSSLKYFQASAAFTYKWNSSRYLSHQLELPKLTYSKRLNNNSAIDSLDFSNSEVVTDYYTHRSVFIPQISYTFTLDRSFGDVRQNNMVWRTQVAESGNILSGIWNLAGENGGGVSSKKLFGVPFSQYIKVQSQIVYSRRFLKSHYIVGRALVGAGFVLGNSDYMPYGEDFYAGGPNTIRAFGIKSLGPGSFRDVNGFNSQFLHSGSFQFIMNIEYRFPIVGFVNGALFVDAGNVWLLKDPLNAYPGGVLKGKNFLDEIALGTGIGLRLDFDMLVVRADLGVGIHAPYDTGKSGYYNMKSFGNSLALNLAVGYPF